MVWREVAKIVVAVVEATGKALARAAREEYNATREAAKRQAADATAASSSASGADDGATSSSASTRRALEREAASANARLGITLQEAMQILNVQQPLSAEEVHKRYDHLFSVNDRKKGGTLYLQAKVYRAKERLDAELDRISREREEKTNRREEEERQQRNGEET